MPAVTDAVRALIDIAAGARPPLTPAEAEQLHTSIDDETLPPVPDAPPAAPADAAPAEGDAPPAAAPEA
jgi:hypothetical protein